MKTDFAVGRRWLCKREKKGKEDFEFLILGPGDGPAYKKCLLVKPGTDEWFDPHGPRDFSRKHIRRYATLVKEEI